MTDERKAVPETPSHEWLDPYFALFNGHLNDAADRARAAFVKKYGPQEWDRRIQPFIDRGVMSIFHQRPDEWTQFYVDQIHGFVNEGIPEPKRDEDGKPIEG